VHPLFLSEAVEFAGSPKALHESKARKHGHCRGRTSSIGADRGDDGIWIYELAGSFITFKNVKIASGRLTRSSRHRQQPDLNHHLLVLITGKIFMYQL
jgi:hypothetical protein